MRRLLDLVLSLASLLRQDELLDPGSGLKRREYRARRDCREESEVFNSKPSISNLKCSISDLRFSLCALCGPKSQWATAGFALALILPLTASAQVGLQPNSARDCAVCHLNWVDSFARPRQAVLLMDPPGAGVVSEGGACLGCHDGGVGDDRYRVWGAHSHLTGIKPPADMKVPQELPLKNGELACRTCHTAHSGQGPETLATTVFLRMRNDASQLCMTCHADKTKGPELGTHPVGGMPWPVPETLLAAGAKKGPDPQRLVCETCHTPHGATEDQLLVMGTQSSQLCLTCHEKMRPGLWRADASREHPQNPPLDEQQQQAVKAMGTRVGDNNTLICLSCHKLHHGTAGRAMLADTLHNSDLCLRCHPGRSDMFNTQHDLRVSAPEERNRLGQTPEQSGPCGACHSFHQFARRPDPQPLDPSGLCATCHQQGQCAEKATGLPFSHPVDIGRVVKAGSGDLPLFAQPGNPAAEKTLACLTCHDPHRVKNQHFLRVEPTAICAACHSDKLASMGDAHDFSDRPELMNAKGEAGAQAGKCGFCHGVHNAIGSKMWVATKQAPKNPNEWCVQCHTISGTDSVAKMTNLRHPSGPDATLASLLPDDPADSPPVNQSAADGLSPLNKGGLQGGSVPLYNEQGQHSEDGFVACGSCHDPHGGGKGSSDNMLRQTQQAGDAGLCAACHGEALAIKGSLHSSLFLDQHFQDAANCAPCHAVHEKPGMPPTGMWAAPLGPETDAAAIRQCTGCHSPGGSAPAITPTVHPVVPMANLVGPSMAGWMPLFDERGHVSTTGTIGCGTCHLPHGPLSGEGLPVNPATVSVEELRKLRPMVRPYVTPNVCSSCHGFDGLRRYLYYHDPDRRRGLPQEGQ